MMQPSFVVKKPEGSKRRWLPLVGVLAIGAGILLFATSANNSDGNGPIARLTGRFPFLQGLPFINKENPSPRSQTFLPPGAVDQPPPTTMTPPSETPPSPGAPPSPGPVVGVNTAPNFSGDSIFSLVNQHRKSNGIVDIQKSEKFCSLAKIRAQELSKNWSQKKVIEKQDLIFQDLCPECSEIGEVAARNHTTPKAVLDDWLATPKTKSDLEFPSLIGCAAVYSPGADKYYVALEWGRRGE